MKHSLVRDWMTQEVMLISADTTLTDLYSLMLHEHIRHLPVLDNNRLVGIISQGDMRSAVSLSLSEENRGMINLVAEEIMTPDPLTIPETATICEAAQLMLANKISGLPVVDESEGVVGIITETDILRLVVQSWS